MKFLQHGGKHSEHRYVLLYCNLEGPSSQHCTQHIKDDNNDDDYDDDGDDANSDDDDDDNDHDSPNNFYSPEMVRNRFEC